MNDDKKIYAGFVTHFELARSQSIGFRIENGYAFSDSYSRDDWGLERKEVFFIVLDATNPLISAAMLVVRVHGTGGTDKPKYSFSNPVSFTNSIDIRKVFPLDGNNLQISSPEAGTRLQPEKWTILVEATKRENPDQAQQLDALLLLVDRKAQILGGDNKRNRLAEQRDSVGLALEIAGIKKSATLSGMTDQKIERAESVLDLIDNLVIQERTLVEHDQQFLERFLIGNIKGALVGADQERRVRIYVTDKTVLETALGVDLMIYQPHYDAFTLVQYKAMEKEERNGGSIWQYKKDTQLESQLDVMTNVMNHIEKIEEGKPDVWHSRLNTDPFFFKFCERRKPKARDDGLVPGLTLSAQHTREFLDSERAEGSKGGRSIGYFNYPKYLNNTEFIALARGGWIGTNQAGSVLVGNVLRANQEGGRAAVFAILDIPQQPAKVHRRTKKG